LNVERTALESKSKEQATGRILVVRIVLDDLRCLTCVHDLFVADVPLDCATESVTAEFEFPHGKLSSDFIQ